TMGGSVRVVSLPCWEAFQAQDEAYRRQVLGDRVPRVSIEAAATFGWEEIIGTEGLKIGIDRFGASAPASDLAAHFGFTAPEIADRIRRFLDSGASRR
ncbi:MAG TPA: transketolase, partial [Acidimicrobiia bacterium]